MKGLTIASNFIKHGAFIVGIEVKIRGTLTNDNASLLPMHMDRLEDRVKAAGDDPLYVKILLDTDGLQISKDSNGKFGTVMRAMIGRFAAVEHVARTGLPCLVENDAEVT